MAVERNNMGLGQATFNQGVNASNHFLTGSAPSFAIPTFDITQIQQRRPKQPQIHKCQLAFVSTITQGLMASTVSRCDRWAERYRYMAGPPFPGPWNFKHHPWLRAMHNDRTEMCVGKKAAQMGYTETMLNVTFFTMDQLHRDVLYVLPNQKPDAADFSATRFDVALEASEHIEKMFSNIKNVNLKRAGFQSLYIRGSHSRSQLKSLPAGLIILDEFEEFDESALPLVKERLSGQLELQKQIWMISTPMVPNDGIDKQYELSNQMHFVFKCPHCHRLTELTFPECLVIVGESELDPRVQESHIICKECQQKLEHAAKEEFLAEGFWNALYPDRPIKGYYINQLYSPTVTPAGLAIASLKAQLNAADEQEFWNSKMGLAHVVANAALTDEHLNNAIRNYNMDDPGMMKQRFITTIGIDVGSLCHYEVTQYVLGDNPRSFDINQEAKARVLAVGTFKDFEEADRLMQIYKPSKVVVDHMPETRSAQKFARRWPGRVALCHYGNQVKSKDILDYGENISVDRTTWLDQALSRFIHGAIILPKDIPHMYKQHVKALVRVYAKDKKGETITFYKKVADDHYAHCRCYSEIALKMTQGLGVTQSIEGRVVG